MYSCVLSPCGLVYRLIFDSKTRQLDYAVDGGTSGRTSLPIRIVESGQLD